MDVMWLVILQANQSWREARRGMGDATPSRNHWHNELITLYRRFDASSSFEINHKVRESSSEESWITSLTSIPWGAYSYGLVLRVSLKVMPKVMPTLSSLLGFIRISWSRVGGLWAKARMTADLVDWVGWNVLRLIKSGRRLEVDAHAETVVLESVLIRPSPLPAKPPEFVDLVSLSYCKTVEKEDSATDWVKFMGLRGKSRFC